MKIRFCAIAFLAVSLLGIYSLRTAEPTAAQAASPATDKKKPEAVEDDMHEFMEYVFQPTYKRLKQSMAVEPADNAAWKGIKADALILAEGGNLLLFRSPEEGSDVWAEHSVAVRQQGGKLYQAAKKKDYAAASQSYKAMLIKCNACHDQFADGEHQLSP